MRLLLSVLLVLFLTSCSMQKYCNNRFPPATKDSIRYVEKIVYRDTTVHVYFQGDTIRDTVYLDTVSNTARSFHSTALASSFAFWDGHRLLHELVQKDSTLAILLANAIKDHSKEVYKDREVVRVVEKNILTGLQNFQIIGFRILVLILILFLIWKRLSGSTILSGLIQLIKKRKPP
jgi:hypothetical protein